MYRDFDVQRAIERFSATVKWRHEFNIESLLTETFPEEIFGKVGHVFGRDKEGRPITYVCDPKNNMVKSELMLGSDLLIALLHLRYNIYGGGIDIQAVFSDLERFLR